MHVKVNGMYVVLSRRALPPGCEAHYKALARDWDVWGFMGSLWPTTQQDVTFSWHKVFPWWHKKSWDIVPII